MEELTVKVQWMEKPVEVKRTDKVTKVKITVKVRTEDGETGEAGEEDRERQDSAVSRYDKRCDQL